MIRKFIKTASFVSVVLALIILPVSCIVRQNTQYTEYKYQLDEISNGVYAIYYNTHSRVPAYNYDVVTLCCDGNVHTFKGDVYISYTNDKPHAVARISNLVNSDDVYVYVPKGTVVYQPSVDIGR